MTHPSPAYQPDAESERRNEPDTTCPTCNGGGELSECANDGSHGCSHINDREYPCPDCGGTGDPTYLGDRT